MKSEKWKMELLPALADIKKDEKKYKGLKIYKIFNLPILKPIRGEDYVN